MPYADETRRKQAVNRASKAWRERQKQRADRFETALREIAAGCPQPTTRAALALQEEPAA
ncbi:MAG: hypothetical protein M0Z28_19165 [Rhodospirillales bacterium]|nr:hypothetical protein [Rhodospirillales bacterium]